MNQDTHDEIWRRLCRGETLQGLELPSREGRVDLTGLNAPAPPNGEMFAMSPAQAALLQGLLQIKAVQWKSLDFSACRLHNLRFSDCMIIDCVFDKASCQDWRIRGTTFGDTSFRAADLRYSLLGGDSHTTSKFQNIDFSRADLRGTNYSMTEFVGCAFKNTKLKSVEFDGTCFADCRFEGELREVRFTNCPDLVKGIPPNEMLRVDFSRAQLRFVEFRNLNLEHVTYPQDSDHIVLDPYLTILDRVVASFEHQSDTKTKVLHEFFRIAREYAGTGQMRGVVNTRDIVEFMGQEGLRLALEAIGSAREGLD